MCQVKFLSSEDCSAKDVGDTVYVTRHAEKRLKERVGWNRNTQNRMVKKVVDGGRYAEDIKGSLGIFLRKKLALNPGTMIVYGQYLYIFRDSYLITAYDIHRYMRWHDNVGEEGDNDESFYEESFEPDTSLAMSL